MRLHFSFHNCLTKYNDLVLNNVGFTKNGYRHFNIKRMILRAWGGSAGCA